jgi:putative ABC transport system substrate-binding protein
MRAPQRRHGRRRALALLAALAPLAPLHAAFAQPADRVRRIGMLFSFDEGDPEAARRLAMVRAGLAALGWVEGRTLAIDVEYGGTDSARTRARAAALVARAPDVLFGSSTPILRALQQQTRTTPIVFAGVSDPVGDGFAASLTRPGGNITGFQSFDPPTAGKWLELLKEVVPTLGQATVIFNPDTAPHGLFMPALAAAAPLVGLVLAAAPVRSAGAIDAALAAAAHGGNGGLVVMPDVFMMGYRAPIIALAARHRVPAVYSQPLWAAEGGLMAYGPDYAELYRRSADYIDRILKGADPAALPVQAPSRFELVFNLATARALGIAVPATVLARADAVIE